MSEEQQALEPVTEINPRVFRIGGFALSPTGIRSIGTPEYEDWVSVMSYLKTVHGAIQFWIGDAVNLGIRIYGDKSDQIIDSTELSEETLRNYAWVAEKVPPESRRPDLSFTHHQLVAGMLPSEQAEWLDKAAHGDTEGDHVGVAWSSSKLKERLQAANIEKVFEYGLSISGFLSPADRDIVAQEHERIGRDVKKTSRMKTPKPAAKAEAIEQL